jgi:glycosyltransferase involved in cell wall biosynthesis
MRILYLSQYFPPEAGATQSRAYDMAKSWTRLGHQITMVTEIPNHPSGIIPPAYKGRFYEKTNLDGIDIIRVWVKASPNKNFRNRMLFYLSYMLNAVIAGTFLVANKYDFIYATSPPLFVGGAALLLRVIKRIPFIFEVRDLWPESAVALGELKNPRTIAWASHLEEICYKKAAQIVVVTQGIYARLAQSGVPGEKLIIIPNGANIELFTFSCSDRERIRRDLGLSEKFVAIYAGIHGIAQGLETIIQTARLLQDRQDIHFLFIGEGPRKADLQRLATDYHLINITFLPEKPRTDIPSYLSAADIALIPLRKADIFTGVLPSKIFDAWACERPVIICIDGEARKVVESVYGGIYSPPEDSHKLAFTLREIATEPGKLLNMGKNGRKFTQDNHSRDILAKKLIIHLQKYISLDKNQ